MSRFRHQQRQSRRQSEQIPPLVVFPPTMLMDSFRDFAAKQFPTMVPDSPQFRCLRRAWFFGVLFYQGVINAAAELPSSTSIQMLQSVEQQLEAYIRSIMQPHTQKSDNAAEPTADSGTDSGTNSQATDNTGEHDAGNQEQSGGQDTSGTRDA